LEYIYCLRDQPKIARRDSGQWVVRSGAGERRGAVDATVGDELPTESVYTESTFTLMFAATVPDKNPHNRR